MKFNYQATILIGTVALASNFNAGQANASDCISLYVPWKWELTKSGTSNISVYAENTGSGFSTVPDSKPLTGAYLVNLLFEEPNNYCEKLGNAPTETILSIVGSFTGVLGTDFLPIPTIPGLKGPFAGASAFVNILEPPFDKETLFVGQKDINQTGSTAITLGDGNSISFAGNLDAFAYKGLTIGSLGFSLASAHLDLSATFLKPTTGWVEYKVPAESVPEPLTILGSATAVGFGAFFKREHSKKPKKS